MDASRVRPLVTLVIGDPAGISPELTARLAADREVAEAIQLLIVGDIRARRAGSDPLARPGPHSRNGASHASNGCSRVS
jgi:4-hydroxy-L-threonine phosphate dehydrogenase PdxA